MKMKELKKIGIYKWPKAIGHLFASYTYPYIYTHTHTHIICRQTACYLFFLKKKKVPSDIGFKIKALFMQTQ